MSYEDDYRESYSSCDIEPCDEYAERREANLRKRKSYKKKLVYVDEYFD